jgi:hypothetical protein
MIYVKNCNLTLSNKKKRNDFLSIKKKKKKKKKNYFNIVKIFFLIHFLNVSKRSNYNFNKLSFFLMRFSILCLTVSVYSAYLHVYFYFFDLYTNNFKKNTKKNKIQNNELYNNNYSDTYKQLSIYSSLIHYV